jgi:hypothetical protein
LPVLLLDQQELLTKDLSNHLICIFKNSFHYTKEFQLEFLKNGKYIHRRHKKRMVLGVPTIISQTDIGIEPWWRCNAVLNQKAYSFVYFHFDKLQGKYEMSLFGVQ